MWSKDFRFGNKSLNTAAKEWCKDSSAAEAQYGHISGWNTSEVTSMEILFSAAYNNGCDAAKQFNDDISRWNEDRVENMNGMFYGAESFNQDLSGWNVKNCEIVQFMFVDAKKFNKDSIINWDLSGKNTDHMFRFKRKNGKKNGGRR